MTVLSAGLLRRWLPARLKDGHKGDFGHVMVAAGSRGMMGAARLCALGALRGGAGLVTAAAPAEERFFLARGPWEAMTLPLPSRGGAFSAGALRPFLAHARARSASAVVAGPGLSQAPGAGRFLAGLWKSLALPLVADADALNLLAAGRFPHRAGPLVLTPHPGEAARLLKTSTAKVQSDRPAAARALAERFNAVVVLKGAGTLVTDGRALYRNPTGHPGMATGGMGDVLAGLIGALIAQVRSANPLEACLRAASVGVWVHGRAGERAARELGPVGIVASDAALRLPAALKEILC